MKAFNVQQIFNSFLKIGFGGQVPFGQAPSQGQPIPQQGAQPIPQQGAQPGFGFGKLFCLILKTF